MPLREDGRGSCAAGILPFPTLAASETETVEHEQAPVLTQQQAHVEQPVDSL